jgi:amidase
MRLPLVICFLAAAGLSNPETREAVADHYYNTFSHTNPVFLRINQGDIVITKTLDSSGMDERDQLRATGGNPLIGPFYIDNAELGDAIVVHLRKVRLNRNRGSTAYRLAPFSVLPEYVESMYPNHYKPDAVRKGRDNILRWDLDLKSNIVKLREPVSNRIKLDFPARPMLGCIGVAGPGDFSPTSGPSGSYGGNLDYNEIAEGAKVILPVYHKGALLFMGDGHAIMADGEPTGTGGTDGAVEISF